jgi:Tol biopolymer transport system component
MQKQQVITLTLKNEVVGEFVNQQFLPGYTFGWAPQPLRMITYCTQTGRVAVMDEEGQKQELAGTREAVLPAWSADGSKIAYLQKSGKKKYTLLVIDIKE